MATSDKLLQLITDLQHGVTVQQGRHTLLNYAHTNSSAHLALLFILAKERHILTLLERSGRRSPQPRERSSKGQRQPQHAFNPKHISAQGLFGSALHQQSLLSIASPALDSRSLEEERYWIGGDERIILSAIGEAQGVLVLCFGPEHKTPSAVREQLQLNEGNLLVCTTLLSAYLATTAERAEVPDGSLLLVPRRGGEMGMGTLGYLDRPGVEGPIHPRATRVTRASHPHLPISSAPTETRSYGEQLQTALDQERRRIAHDLHDGVAQQLAHVIHKLEFIQLMLVKQPDVAQQEITRTADVLKASLQELRHGISSLLPAQLEEQGFEDALQHMVDEYAYADTALKIEYDVDDMALVPLALEVPIFRFLQEALNNVRKHAQASWVRIRVRIFAGLLVIEVLDNGRGFDVEQVMNRKYADATQQIGLRAMHDRIAQAGGSWELQSKPGEGTSVRARFLLTPHASVLTQREREVLRLLVQGLTNRAIAARLSVSTETVKSHIQHIMQKMQVHDRTQAAVIATKQQWL